MPRQMREWCCGVFLCITFGLLVCCSQSQARYHHHYHHHGHRNHKHKQQHSHHPISQISYPPSPSPSPSPSDDDDGIFDVRAFGAVGDGMTDDTQAFKEAWDAACQVESATLLVPSAYSFLIHSTIFTGPCQTGFVFQVPTIC